MRSAREWVLAQPGGEDFSPAELEEAVRTIEARDAEVERSMRRRTLLWTLVGSCLGTFFYRLLTHR